MPTQAPPPRLAYLSSVIPALSATFIYREILELDRRGYSLQLYSLRREDLRTLSAESLPFCERTYYLLPVRLGDLLISHLRFFCLTPHRYFCTVWKMLTAPHYRISDWVRSLMHFGEGVVLARRMKRDGITHVHGHYASQATSVARVVHHLTGITYSFSAHAHDIWHDRLLLPEKLNEARFVACCSELGRQELIKQGDPANLPKVHRIYHGIDVRRFKPPELLTRKPGLVLSVGRLDEVKGFPYLLQACQLLQDRGVDYHCTIVGEGEERPRLESLIRQLGLQKRVRLAGAVPQERIIAYYHEASVFVLPSLEMADGRHEGVPNVIVEAMATGLPVVVTAIGAIPEAVEDGRTGFLAPQRNPSRLAEIIETLLRTPDLRERIGVAARQKVERDFDNRACIEPLIRLFQHECGITAGCPPTVHRQASARPCCSQMRPMPLHRE